LAQRTTEVKILVPGRHQMVSLLGQRDELLKLIESSFPASILVRGNEIHIAGLPEEAGRVAYLFEELIALLDAEQVLTTESIERTIDMVKTNEARPSEVLTDTALTHRGKAIRPKTNGQKQYVDAIRKSTITFAIGPAGTGKSYLAVAMAVRALLEKEVSRIILTRPAVEAGERLGFLPGTLYEKIDPYMRPLYDALMDMIDAEKMQQLISRGTIEISPLAFMRGRTLNDSFIILDEAQNTTPEQMKMFLTRLGFRSKVIVTGDVTQIDLPSGQLSGLNAAREILTDIDGVSFVFMNARDVVRHKIVQEIVEAYRRFDESR
jgi:phosphate starvation-inducible PhoH-like protein